MAAVEHVFVKLPGTREVLSVDGIRLTKGVGVEGDASAHESSPRQILVVRAEDAQDFDLPPGYLRENIMVRDLPASEFAPGACLEFGGGAKVFLTMHCEPCKTIASRVPRLSSIIGRRGVLGIVVAGGTVQPGASCEAASSPLEPLGELPMHRVHSVVRRIPMGHVVTYKELLLYAGLKGPYYRVMPKYLAAALRAGLPAHRVLDTAMQVPDVTRHSSQLLIEEIEAANHFRASDLAGRRVITSEGIWRPQVIDLLTPAH